MQWSTAPNQHPVSCCHFNYTQCIPEIMWFPDKKSRLCCKYMLVWYPGKNPAGASMTWKSNAHRPLWHGNQTRDYMVQVRGLLTTALPAPYSSPFLPSLILLLIFPFLSSLLHLPTSFTFKIENLDNFICLLTKLYTH